MAATNAEMYRVPFPKLKSTLANLETKVVTFSEVAMVESAYVWQIQNFNWKKLAKMGIIQSDIFYTEGHDEIAWCMSIEGAKNSSLDNVDLAYVRIRLKDTCINIKANYQFYILDNNHAKNKKGALITAFNSGKDRSAFSIITVRRFVDKTWSPTFLSDGNLKILCEVTTQFELKKDGIARDLAVLHESQILSDVTLIVQGVKFPAHKNILSCRSPVFAKMFEKDMTEKEKNVVEISYIEPEVMKEMLRFIYTGRVNSIEELDLELFAAAEKYDLKDLKLKCENVLCDSIDANNAMALLIHADLYRSERLNNCVRKFIIDNNEEVSKSAIYKTAIANGQLAKYLPLSE